MSTKSKSKKAKSKSKSKDGFLIGTTRNMCDFELQPSIYYTDGHRAYSRYLKKVHAEFISQYWDGYSLLDETQDLPRSFFTTMAQKYSAAYIFPFGYPVKGYDTFVADDGTQHKSFPPYDFFPQRKNTLNVFLNRWDPFYQIIFCYEVMGASWGLNAWIHYIALPSVIWYGRNAVHRRVAGEVMRGEKLISLAASELSGGSDVANMQTTARLSDDGRHYICDGNKYWCTGGTRADYFVTVVRTSPGKGAKGLSLLLIPRTEGVFTSKLRLQSLHLNGTAAVTFHQVKVPVENLIGEEGEGFKYTMSGFNFERFCFACDATALSRLALEETVLWAKERKTFGRALIKHQVIAHKIAEMSRMIMSAHAFLEKVAYQLKFDKSGMKDKSLPRNCALVKVHCTRTMEKVLAQASQIFGGRSFVQNGRGKRICEGWRMIKAGTIAAGANDTLIDFAVKSAKL